MTSKLVCVLLSTITLLSLTWCSSMNSILSLRSMKSLETDLMDTVIEGARMALDGCQKQFKWERWNCPETAVLRHGRQPSTKETAFLVAITSAGIVYSITRNCSRGDLTGCISATEMSGPSNYLDYGEQITQQVLNEADNGRDPQAFANLHNNAAGRMAVRTTMQKRCRCHGVSGSCSLQTCWMQMAAFSKISEELRTRYDRAERLDLDPAFNTVGDTDITRDIPKEDLVYLLDSPNYCRPNTMAGWPGTSGRACSRNKAPSATRAERKSCKTLCRECGHRVRRERSQTTRRCNCTFHWCCEVKCDTCRETVDQFFCE
ncbi:Wnt oncogene analog 2 [Carabus blaptoides fortunei]